MQITKSRDSAKLLDRWYQMALWCAFQVLRCWWFIRRPSHHGALILIWCQNRVLLVRNSYQPCWSSPGGSVERGESSLDAVIRECKEETGLHIELNEAVLIQETTLKFRFREDKISIFECYFSHAPRIEIDFREITEVKWLDLHEVLSLNLVPHLRIYFENLIIIQNSKTESDYIKRYYIDPS
jgi:8-oxo-dGTP pyrophosphatase MutT (NUDIX family)